MKDTKDLDFKEIEEISGEEEEESEDFEETEENNSNEYVLVNTVQGNSKGYTRHDIKKDHEARRLQGMIGNPTKQKFAGIVHEKLIANCPVTVQDIHNANQRFGLGLANLRGKTTRTKPEHIRVDYVKIHWDFIQMHKYVTLVADVLFVNGLPFLVTSLREISLIMIEILP